MYDTADGQIILYGPKYVGKWTSPTAGQSQFGGISQEGLTRFEELKALAVHGRSARGLEVETAFLRQIRAKKRIEAPTFAEERANKRRKNSRAVQQAPAMRQEEVQAAFDV
jgi:hypothetical protein